uniref:Fe2OG dioxygenase domain-containing protein n=1 Tax=Panagrolaimus sp. ES5 TaxID=591445 RepID=A0AC34F293_9BILA
MLEPQEELPGGGEIGEEESEIPRIVLNADDFIVKSAPLTIRYIPNFIDTEMEEYLLWQVENAPKPKWEFLKNRRLQNWGGIVGKKSLISDNSMPQWLTMMIDKIMELENGFPESNRPNHVLVNEYLPGQGIMAHTDGPAFFPMVSTISLGSHTFLDLYEPINDKEAKTKSDRYIGSMFLQPRSLILIKDKAYKVCLHGIEERNTDKIHEKIFNRPSNLSIGTELKRSTRVSLTIRNVPVVNTALMNRIFNKTG